MEIVSAIWFQTSLSVMSILSIFLLALNNKKAGGAGALIGLLSEPFWIYSSYMTKQWGILVTTIFYIISYSMGIYNYWIKKDKKHKK